MKNLDVLVEALSATRGAVTIADARQKNMPLIYCNRAFLSLTGYDESDVVGENCRFLQGDDTDSTAVDNIRAAIKNKSDVRVVIKNYRKNGSPFWNDLMMSPVFDKSGVLTHYIGLQLDVTLEIEREASERQARELELENVTLKKEAEMLARLNDVKDDFISIASHQLRTPATVVKQNLGLLTEGFVGEMAEAQIKLVQTAYESNNRLIKIINELLRHARINANNYAVASGEVNLTKMVSDIVATYAGSKLNIDRIITLEVETKRDLLCHGDGELIRSMLENVIDNAIAYSYDNSKIDVTLQKDGKTARITIADEGVGIKDEDKPKLFKKFARVQSDHKFNIGGTGLGLYWVKTVADLHNGTVNVRDNTPKGTVFVIELPIEH